MKTTTTLIDIFACGALISAVSQLRRLLRRFSRSADRLVRKFAGSGKVRADKAFRDPLVAVLPLCVLVTGCLLKPAAVSTRRFVLTPSPAASQCAESGQLSIGLGRVNLPEYLLRDSMAIRRGTNEIEYLENALWAERLDQSFQRVLGANLSSRLDPARIHLSAWQSGEVSLVVRVRLEQLDVDSHGRGFLVARWRIEAADTGKVLRDGQTSLDQTGSPPFGNPSTVAATLSDLSGQFSRILAQAVCDCAAGLRSR